MWIDRFMKAAQAYAFAYGREYAIPDDIQPQYKPCSLIESS